MYHWGCVRLAVLKEKSFNFLNHKYTLCNRVDAPFASEFMGIRKGGLREKTDALPLLQSIHQCKKLTFCGVQNPVIICKWKVCGHYAQEALVVNSLCQGQIPEAPTALHCYHSAGIPSLTPKGIPPRPIRHSVANIAERSFEVAYGWNLVNTNRVRGCPAFAL